MSIAQSISPGSVDPSKPAKSLASARGGVLRKIVAALTPFICLGAGAHILYQSNLQVLLTPSVELSFLQGVQSTLHNLKDVQLSHDVQLRDDNQLSIASIVTPTQIPILKVRRVSTHKKASVSKNVEEEMDTQGLALLISTSLVADVLEEHHREADRQIASQEEMDIQSFKFSGLNHKDFSLEVETANSDLSSIDEVKLKVPSAATMNTQALTHKNFKSTKDVLSTQITETSSANTQAAEYNSIDAKTYNPNVGGAEYSNVESNQLVEHELPYQDLSTHSELSTQSNLATQDGLKPNGTITITSLNPPITKVLDTTTGISTLVTNAKLPSKIETPTSISVAANNAITAPLRGADTLVPQSRSLDVQSSSASAVADDTIITPDFSFQIFSGFTHGETPVVRAQTQILGSPAVEVSNAQGVVSFGALKVSGILPVHIEAPDYLPRNVEILSSTQKGGSIQIVELLSRNTLRAFEIRAGESQNSDRGLFFGQLVSEVAEDLAGFEMTLTQLDHPEINFQSRYIGADGVLETQAKSSTQEIGQFLFMNVQPGAYLLSARHPIKGDRAPHIINVSAGEGIIQKINLGRPLKVTGHVVDATTQSKPLQGAEVQLLGVAGKVETSKAGDFDWQGAYVDCFSKNYLQIQKPGFYRNRVEFICNEQKNAYYVFPQTYVDSAAADAEMNLDSRAAFISGHIKANQSLRMQLLGAGEITPSQEYRGFDFYFDNDGSLNPDKNHTVENGNFVFVNAPSGLSYIQAVDRDNKSVMFSPVFLSESTISVFLGSERNASARTR